MNCLKEDIGYRWTILNGNLRNEFLHFSANKHTVVLSNRRDECGCDDGKSRRGRGRSDSVCLLARGGTRVTVFSTRHQSTVDRWFSIALRCASPRVGNIRRSVVNHARVSARVVFCLGRCGRARAPPVLAPAAEIEA